jgi:tetratricopeptide (TPR) repeat protein
MGPHAGRAWALAVASAQRVRDGSKKMQDPRSIVVRIAEGETTLVTGEGRGLSHKHSDLDTVARHLLRRLEHGLSGHGITAYDRAVQNDESGEPGSGLDRALREAGRMLVARFLGEAAAQAIADELAIAATAGVSLRVGLEVNEAQANLPWETITLPDEDTPLVLHTPVELYRSVGGLRDLQVTAIPGPLRILAVIASPEHGNGELLDYEAELSRILDVVELARRGDAWQSRHGAKAHVRVLNWGSRAAIRRALLTERFHVLHISCHAAAGKLVLESEDGRPDQIDARGFARDVLVRDRAVPLVVLSACSTAKAPSVGGASPGTAWRSMAQDLLASGVPAVLAMTSPVTDSYATELLSVFYAELAAGQAPEPLAALADARRAVERARAALPLDHPQARWREWATPALFLRGPSSALFDPDLNAELVEGPWQPVFAKGMIVRGNDHFVGRRAELRRLLHVLRSDTPAVVIHGLGGVGKSTLAARLVNALGRSAGLVVTISGTATADQILLALADRLSSWCFAHDISERDARYRLVNALRDGHQPWQERLAAVAEHLLSRLPVTLVLDNFEDNLSPADGSRSDVIVDGSVAEFLAAWLALPRWVPLIITSRYAFPMPANSDRSWHRHHLGPLSPAEARKLVWRLPALEALTADEQRRAIADVGGHPRTLEYLDALLRAGTAQFPDITGRLEQHLLRRGVPDPQAWFTEVSAADLDLQLAETITMAADDILLTDLLACLDNIPLARQLLVGASVYRQPVDETGLMRLVSETRRDQSDPELDRLHSEISRRVALSSDPQASGTSSKTDVLAAIQDYFEQVRRPPDVPSGFAPAMAALLDLGLLNPAEGIDAYHVHRWTAVALARLASADELTAAHRLASDDYSLRILPLMDALRFSPQNLTRVIWQIEAAYHFLHLGDQKAIPVLVGALDRLHSWGLWDWEERICQDTRAHIPEDTAPAATLCRTLGTIACDRGNYADAERWYRQALAIDDSRGDEHGQALDNQELGLIAGAAGDWARAAEYHHKAVSGFTTLGDERNLAGAHLSLGIAAQETGNYAGAEDWYQKSIAVGERTNDRRLLASGYGQMGILAAERGEYAAAERWQRQSLDLKTALDDTQAIAGGWKELGTLAARQGRYATGRERLNRALEIFERLGDRAGIMLTYANLGDLAEATEDIAMAEQWYTEAAAIAHQLGRHEAASCYDRLIRFAVRRKDLDSGRKWASRLVDLHSQVGSPLELAEACRTAASFCMVNEDLPGAFTYRVRGLKSLPAGTAVPEAHLDIPRSFRSALGDDEFLSMLAELLPPDDTNQLLAALDDEASNQQGNPAQAAESPPDPN